ncbi:MAG: glycosyltransferase family 39 protein [Candidatus Bathyarchaeota archaeon]|nr:glycosyltransferase family 39 protein [Candidatus Bathyarchaeota archaeon]
MQRQGVFGRFYNYLPDISDGVLRLAFSSLVPKSRLLSRSRVALIVFTCVFGFFLLFNIGYNSVRWDELVHCSGAWQLLHGQFADYFSLSTFYPPMFNLATAACFVFAGPTVLSARLVAVTFSLLSLWILFELTNRLYDSKIALLSAVFFGVMPGIVWVSRFGYIETMLEFFFLGSLFLFLTYLRTDENKYLILGGLTLGLGFLVKYQILVAGLVMLAVLFISGRSYIKRRLKHFLILLVIVAAIGLSWFALSYALAPDTLGRWIYAISAGDQCRAVYSMRFPVPVYYLFEMVSPYPNVHPISPLLYLLGFAGLGLLVWRRKPQDKILLAWFTVVYVAFTLVGNRQWRYVMPLYPVLAVSASVVVYFVYDKLKTVWQKKAITRRKKEMVKVAACCLIVFTAAAVFVSCVDAYNLVSTDQVQIPVQEAVEYVAQRIQPNQSVMLLCPFDFFSGGMVTFYLQTNNKNNPVQGYPVLPVDSYTPTFDIDVLISRCQGSNVTYVLLSEFRWTTPYFNTTLTPQGVAAMLSDSGRFQNEASVGIEPNRILILSFT